MYPLLHSLAFFHMLLHKFLHVVFEFREVATAQVEEASETSVLGCEACSNGLLAMVLTCLDMD